MTEEKQSVEFGLNGAVLSAEITSPAVTQANFDETGQSERVDRREWFWRSFPPSLGRSARQRLLVIVPSFSGKCGSYRREYRAKDCNSHCSQIKPSGKT